MKTALLSNINIDPIVRLLSEDLEMFPGEGYGGLFELLLNPASSLNRFAPEAAFFLMDISALTRECQKPSEFQAAVDEWFNTLLPALPSGCACFISDADFRLDMHRLIIPDQDLIRDAEDYWNSWVTRAVRSHANVHRFPYRRLCETVGKDKFYSPKLWYLGKIIHSAEAQRILAREVQRNVRALKQAPLKALLLDLDNTLWGGVAGEDGPGGIRLSDDGEGLAYKEMQYVLREIKRAGVLLGIVSKNNESDAMEILRKHPHMVLREEDFAVRKINWRSKDENIREIARELNIGLDAIAFIDDNPTEREWVSSRLPQVTVPDFPRYPEGLPRFIAETYHSYFYRIDISQEDLDKTRQYAENKKRAEFEKSTVDYASFLRQLDLKIHRLEPGEENWERFAQLINKTNQFNLTTRRYTIGQLQEMIGGGQYTASLFSVQDKFGDYGVVSAVIVDLRGEIPRMDSFVLSCRIMGKQIENYIVERVEQEMSDRGYAALDAEYLPTSRNQPVENFFDQLGYTVISQNGGAKEYRIQLPVKAAREYAVREI